MNCPKCGTQNESDALFCLNCGSTLLKQTIESTPANAMTTQNGSFGQPQAQHERPMPPTLSTSGSMQNFTGQGRQAVFNVWGPFAGRGTQRSHNGWLMDNKGDRAGELVQKVNTKFHDRQIPGAQFEHKILTARGVIVEQRPYFLLTRRMTTVGLYIAQFGKDLFVSIASYLKPPISYLRVMIVALMAAFGLYTMFILPNVLENKINGMMSGLMGGIFGGGGGDSSGLMSLLCITGPLGTIDMILLGLLLIFSIYKWVTEKDFFAALRSKPNEFDEDDLMAMEKAVEQTVRMSMDEIGLDSNDLIPLQSQESGLLF